jgi:ATP-dependent protease ClpP protease subunit
MPKPRTFIEASASGTTGTIRIVDRISEYSQSSSSTIKTIVDEYLKTGVVDVEVYINSAGGNCFEATEMCNDLKRLPKVTIKIGSVAASAATYFMTQFPSVAFPNSQIMIHRPKLGTYGDVITIKADLKLLENTTEDYKTAYSTKMNKTVEQIEEFFAQGDYWMTANEAKALGLLDTILDQTEEVTAESIKILEAVAAPVIPVINNENHKQMERKQLISRLKLSADATDAEIDAALAALEAKASKTETLEANAKANQEAMATALVDQAILEKKITADLKDNYLKLANADFEGTKTILNAMQGVTKISAEIEETGTSATGREKWTLENFQENDPEALMEMMSKEPERFKKLEAAYFG